MNATSLRTLAAFLEERTPGCDVRVAQHERGISASIFIDEREFMVNMSKALSKLPHVDWKAFVKRSKPAVGPHASRATMRKAAGL